MDMLTRYKEALERLADEKQMIVGKETGISTPECKTRMLYATRVLETNNRIDSIEAGVMAEMEKQTSGRPEVSEMLLGEVELDGHK